jgi:UDP-glucose 4-epimerase
LTTLKLFERIKEFKKLKKVVYSGAGCAVAEKTFGDAQASKEVDVVPLDADSPYSISKLIGEFYAKYYHKLRKLPVVRARFQNVYGPGEILGAGKWRGTPATVWRNVVPTFVYRALHHQPLPLENDGIASRDFIFVEDIVRGLVCCALHGIPGDVYNLATGSDVTIKDLADTINKLTGNKGGIEQLPKRPWDNSGKRFGCTLKAKQNIGFEAKISFPQGLQHTVEWTRANLPLITKTMQKHREYVTI